MKVFKGAQGRSESETTSPDQQCFHSRLKESERFNTECDNCSNIRTSNMNAATVKGEVLNIMGVIN